jgi:RND superfamily putative drug exporter
VQAVKHPWRYAAASLVVLLALAAPILGMQLGQSDASSESTANTTRRAYDIVDAAFGPGSNGPLVVVEDLTVSGAPAPVALRAQLAEYPGVVAVGAPVLDAQGDTAVITVVPGTGPQAAGTSDLVRTLRADLPPSVSITGATAAFIDFNDLVQEHLVRVIVVVVAASFLLLCLLLRSIVAPLKAALMNLLSVAAAYGAITALFQWGWGTSFLGLEKAVPVNAFVPLFMFAILFGLSMDYEVFLLGRIKEEWDRSNDVKGSVVAGLSSTARVISSAAVIMVAVFAGFAMDDSVAVKMIGTGLAVAVLVDATIVRLVLVPAVMTLMGPATWWLPGRRPRPDAVPVPAPAPAATEIRVPVLAEEMS